MANRLVDAEARIVGLDPSGVDPTQGIVSWSLAREHPPKAIVIDGANGDAALIAFDLRLDLLADPTHYEVTQGLVVTIDSFQVLTDNIDHATTSKLRNAAIAELKSAVLDHALRPPIWLS